MTQKLFTCPLNTAVIMVNMQMPLFCSWLCVENRRKKKSEEKGYPSYYRKNQKPFDEDASQGSVAAAPARRCAPPPPPPPGLASHVDLLLPSRWPEFARPSPSPDSAFERSLELAPSPEPSLDSGPSSEPSPEVAPPSLDSCSRRSSR